jgi:hypothetical protein
MRNGKHDKAVAELIRMNGDCMRKPWELDEHEDAS